MAFLKNNLKTNLKLEKLQATVAHWNFKACFSAEVAVMYVNISYYKS